MTITQLDAALKKCLKVSGFKLCTSCVPQGRMNDLNQASEPAAVGSAMRTEDSHFQFHSETSAIRVIPQLPCHRRLCQACQMCCSALAMNVSVATQGPRLQAHTSYGFVDSVHGQATASQNRHVLLTRCWNHSLSMIQNTCLRKCMCDQVQAECVYTYIPTYLPTHLPTYMHTYRNVCICIYARVHI